MNKTIIELSKLRARIKKYSTRVKVVRKIPDFGTREKPGFRPHYITNIGLAEHLNAARVADEKTLTTEKRKQHVKEFFLTLTRPISFEQQEKLIALAKKLLGRKKEAGVKIEFSGPSTDFADKIAITVSRKTAFTIPEKEALNKSILKGVPTDVLRRQIKKPT